jgi:hypothetical protein
MPIVRLLLAGGIAALFAANGARAEVKVTFHEPQRYTDAGLYGGQGVKAREATLTGLRRHLERLGARYLTGAQSLTLEIQDIDLAGRYNPLRPLGYGVRIADGVTWPRITLRYTLQQDGATSASGEETIRDMDYLTRSGLPGSHEPLFYERAMLDDWFKARFVDHRPVRR